MSFSTRHSLRGKAGLFYLVLGMSLVPGPVHAEDDADSVAKLILFALQCNATVGSIQDVAILRLEKYKENLMVVRGTYVQKTAGVGIFVFKGPEAAGGVFEGTYDVGTHRLHQLSFKVSLRTGAVRPACLR